MASAINPLRLPLEGIPVDIASAADYERLAPDFLSAPAFAHIAGGSGTELTLQRNRTALEGLQIYNRVLRDFNRATTATTLLGHALKHPILLGPVAHQKLVHPEGELATLAGAAATDTPFVTSTLAHTSLEDIAAGAYNPKWFQLYFQPEREVTLSLVKRAEAVGYQALVVTVDVPVNGLRFRAQRAGFTMPEGLTEVNLTGYPAKAPSTLYPHQSIVFDGLMQDAPDWADIQWLQANTSLPVLIKGISHPEDARQARSQDVAGIIVSNHGGRSLDGLPASAEALPLIRQQVGSDFPLLMDGGIRSGGDIFRALALGADAVLIGRLQVYALAVAGALGVAHMLRCLRTELEVTMALAGCPNLQEITQQHLFQSSNN